MPLQPVSSDECFHYYFSLFLYPCNFPTSVLILFVWSLKERSKVILIIKRTLQFSDSIMLSMLEILSAFPNKSRWKKKEKKSKNFSKHLLGILVGFPSVA